MTRAPGSFLLRDLTEPSRLNEAAIAALKLVAELGVH